MALARIPSAGAPTFAAFVSDPATREAVRLAAIQLGWPAADIREGNADTARGGFGAADVLLLDLEGCTDPLGCMDALADVCEAHTRVCAIGVANDVGLYRALRQMGVTDYLVKPVTAAALAEVLDGPERSPPPAPPPAVAGRARTIAVIGARGGAGATSVAVSLAAGLARQCGRTTVLLDLDLHFGAATLSLDLEGGRGLRELLSAPDRVDSLLIGAAAVQESERLAVLGGEESLESRLEVDGAGLPVLLEVLAGSVEAIVMDVPRRIDGLTRAALLGADVVCVVTDLSLVGMRDTHRLVQLIRSLPESGEILLVGNRVGGVPGEALKTDFEIGSGVSLDFSLPFDAKAAAAAAGQGKALADCAQPGPLVAEFGRLIARVAGGDDAVDQKPVQNSLINRLRRTLGHVRS